MKTFTGSYHSNHHRRNQMTLVYANSSVTVGLRRKRGGHKLLKERLVEMDIMGMCLED